MKVLFFLILSLPLGAFASYRVDYNCTPQVGAPYGLTIGSLRNELKFNSAMGAYLKGNACNGSGQCVFTNCANEKVEYWVDQADYDASQVYNQCLAAWAANRGSAPISRVPDCGFSNLPEVITVTEKESGEVTSYTQCIRRDLPGAYATPDQDDESDEGAQTCSVPGSN